MSDGTTTDGAEPNSPLDGPAMPRAAHRPIPRDVLGCIVAGYEKGGTTLVKDLLRNTGRLRSAFEGGLLLAEHPADGIPEPYGANLVESWQLRADFIDRYRRCGSFEEGYRLLRDECYIRRKELPLIDKTPRYMACLADVRRRAPGSPVVVVLRDPLQVTCSWLRLGNTVTDAAAAIRLSTVGLVDATQESADTVWLLPFAAAAADPAGVARELQAWLGREYVPYDPTHQLGTSPAGEAPPPGVDTARLDLSRRWTAAELAAIAADLDRLIPWWRLVPAVPSGPLSAIGREMVALRNAVHAAPGPANESA